MKLGIETNSVINHLESRMTIGAPAPVVGMGCTILGWTDRNAGTIVSVAELDSKKHRYLIEVTHDDAEVISGSGHDGSAEYAFTTRPDGYGTIFVSERKSGKWLEMRRNPDTGRLIKTRGHGLIIGKRDHYRDPCF